MWAGGALTFSGDFRVGDVVARRSRIDDVTLKQGGTGPLCFVTVTHDYTTPRGLALSERQDIVYRELEAKPSVAPSSAAPPLPATGPAGRVSISPSISRASPRW
jgi:3-methylfumaryl-CoA hydratase